MTDYTKFSDEELCGIMTGPDLFHNHIAAEFLRRVANAAQQGKSLTIPPVAIGRAVRSLLPGRYCESGFIGRFLDGFYH